MVSNNFRRSLKQYNFTVHFLKMEKYFSLNNFNRLKLKKMLKKKPVLAKSLTALWNLRVLYAVICDE
jgi:hypothetical protein